jgi:hypothetical protein
LLAQAVAKEAQGLRLTPTEENLIAELDRFKNEKRREKMTVDADGTVRIVKTIDAEPIMEAVKAYGDFIDKHTQKNRAQRIVGAIDPVTAYNWMKETGLKIGTKEFAQFAMKRIKHDSEYRKFRVGH